VAPAAPVAVTTVGAEGQAITFPVPTTRAEYRELLTRREELSSQLMNVTSRRREIASEIDATGNAAIKLNFTRFNNAEALALCRSGMFCSIFL